MGKLVLSGSQVDWLFGHRNSDERPTLVITADSRDRTNVTVWRMNPAYLRMHIQILKVSVVIVVLTTLLTLLTAYGIWRPGPSTTLMLGTMLMLSAIMTACNILCPWRDAIPTLITSDSEKLTIAGRTGDRTVPWEQIARLRNSGAMAPLFVLDLLRPPSVLINLSGYTRTQTREIRREVLRRSAEYREYHG